MAFLSPVPADFGNRHAVHADALQRLFGVFELVGLNDRFNSFHSLSPWPVSCGLFYDSKLYPSSPCWLRSRPSTSCWFSTRTPVTTSQIFKMINVPTIANPHAIRTATIW